MIRVRKDPQIPASLQKTGSGYDYPDVSAQLIKDQHGKCYLCERILHTDFEIEHHYSRTNHPHLNRNWDNLFWGCGYCNRKKGSRFDGILNPSQHNIEDLIICIHNASTKNILFDQSEETNECLNKTIELLHTIFNGKDTLRNIKEARFYDYFLSEMINFQQKLHTYIRNKSDVNREIVIESLGMESEFLAFKYHVIKQITDIYAEFKDVMIWNKV